MIAVNEVARPAADLELADARTVVHVLEQPPSVDMHEVVVLPTPPLDEG